MNKGKREELKVEEDESDSLYVDISKVVIRHSAEPINSDVTVFEDTCNKPVQSKKDSKSEGNETKTDEEKLVDLALKKRALSFGSFHTLSHERLKSKRNKGHDPSAISCIDTCCFRFLSRKKAYFYAAYSISKYRYALQEDWKQIFHLMTWFKLPGNEHERAQGCNYLSHQMWLYAFTTAHCGDTRDKDDNKEEYLKEYFEEAILSTEEAGVILRQFIDPVKLITERYKLMEKMTHLVDKRLNRSYIDESTVTLKDASRDLLQEMLLTNNCIQDMTKLKVYTRDVSRMHWLEYRKLRFREQMSQLQKGLNQFTQKVKRITSLLPQPLTRLHQADSSSRRSLKLTKHIKRMEKNLEKIVRKEHMSREDETIIKNVFLETNQHVVYIIEKSRSLVENVWEIILMMRLSYIFVQSGPGNWGTLLPYDEVLKAHLDSATYDKLLNPTITYLDPEMFFECSCPDILRRAPIVINPKAEMALHYEGHMNYKPQSKSRTSSYVKKDTPSNISKQRVLRMLRIDPVNIMARPVQSAGSKASSNSK